MKNSVLAIGVLFLAFATASGANAACYADYKAKQDDPLKLHYGVIELSDGDCADKGKAAKTIAKRIKKEGWQLLSVVSTFDASQLEGKKSSAGEYYLRF